MHCGCGSYLLVNNKKSFLMSVAITI